MLTSPGRPQIITQLPRKQSPTLSHQQQQPQSQSQPQTQSQTQSQQSPQQQTQQQQPLILHQQQNQNTFQDELPSIIAQLKTYSNPDILICGNCRELFSELDELLQHKKTYCKLRFTCKCNSISSTNTNDKNNHEDKISLLCHECKDSFESAWDLIVHVQAAHMLNVYELGTPKSKVDQQHSPSMNDSLENGFADSSKSEEKSSCSDEEQCSNSNQKIVSVSIYNTFLRVNKLNSLHVIKM
ncbi:hypothetical protein V9T40_011418 [Parthenolecanium corni]|uniref:C2H2-type domain-containing protein n=1 Tax=Parthenolecanium corni TaxID=536013 RepID=A0AAN9XYE9_9HEMI